MPHGFVADLRGLVASPHLTLATGTRRDHAARAPADAGARLQPQPQAAEGVHRGEHPSTSTCSCTAARAASSAATSRSSASTGRSGCSRSCRDSPRSAKIADFVDDARLALAHTGNAIRATANPIELDEETERGRTSAALGAGAGVRARAHDHASSALLLAAGALAAERDENAIGRLVRGLVGLGRARRRRRSRSRSSVALGVGARDPRSASGSRSRRAASHGGEPWQRLPLVLVGRRCSPARRVGAVGALVGALAREARTASLVGAPRRAAGRLPRARPARDRPGRGLDQRRASRSSHAVRFFAVGALRRSPWGTVAREAAWLVGLGRCLGALARASAAGAAGSVA